MPSPPRTNQTGSNANKKIGAISLTILFLFSIFSTILPTSSATSSKFNSESLSAYVISKASSFTTVNLYAYNLESLHDYKIEYSLYEEVGDYGWMNLIENNSYYWNSSQSQTFDYNIHFLNLYEETTYTLDYYLFFQESNGYYSQASNNIINFTTEFDLEHEIMLDDNYGGQATEYHEDDYMTATWQAEGTVETNIAIPSYGQWYWEIHHSNSFGNSNIVVGIVSEEFAEYDDHLGKDSNGLGYHSSGYFWEGGSEISQPQYPSESYGITDVIGIALDMDALEIKFSKNGEWQNGGMALTSEILNDTEVQKYPAISSDCSNCNVSITPNFGATTYTFAPPTDYSSSGSEIIYASLISNLDDENEESPWNYEVVEFMEYATSDGAADLALDDNNQPHISYYDSDEGALYYAKNSETYDGNWDHSCVAACPFIGSPDSIAGDKRNSILIDSNNDIHFTYEWDDDSLNTSSAELRYSFFDESSNTFTEDTIINLYEGGGYAASLSLIPEIETAGITIYSTPGQSVIYVEGNDQSSGYDESAATLTTFLGKVLYNEDGEVIGTVYWVDDGELWLNEEPTISLQIGEDLYIKSSNTPHPIVSYLSPNFSGGTYLTHAIKDVNTWYLQMYSDEESKFPSMATSGVWENSVVWNTYHNPSQSINGDLILSEIHYNKENNGSTSTEIVGPTPHSSSALALTSKLNPYFVYQSDDDTLKFARYYVDIEGYAFSNLSNISMPRNATPLSIAIDSDDNPHIAYIDEAENLGYVYSEDHGITWMLEVLEVYTSIFDVKIKLDNNDNPHFVIVTNDEVLYATYSGDEGGTDYPGVVEIIDENPTFDFDEVGEEIIEGTSSLTTIDIELSELLEDQFDDEYYLYYILTEQASQSPNVYENWVTINTLGNEEILKQLIINNMPEGYYDLEVQLRKDSLIDSSTAQVRIYDEKPLESFDSVILSNSTESFNGKYIRWGYEEYPSSAFDSDNDGIPDNYEATIYGTNLSNSDTDQDGTNDGDQYISNFTLDSDGNYSSSGMRSAYYNVEDDKTIAYHTTYKQWHIMTGKPGDIIPMGWTCYPSSYNIDNHQNDLLPLTGDYVQCGSSTSLVRFTYVPGISDTDRIRAYGQANFGTNNAFSIDGEYTQSTDSWIIKNINETTSNPIFFDVNYTSTNLNYGYNSVNALDADGIGLVEEGITSGKYYWEIQLFGPPQYDGSPGTCSWSASIGVAKQSVNLDYYLGQNSKGWGYSNSFGEGSSDGTISHSGGSLSYGPGFGSTSVIGVALDMNLGKIWFSLNGTWVSGTNFSSGAGAAYSNITGEVFPAVYVSAGNCATVTAGLLSAYLGQTNPPPFGFEDLEAITSVNSSKWIWSKEGNKPKYTKINYNPTTFGVNPYQSFVWAPSLNEWVFTNSLPSDGEEVKPPSLPIMTIPPNPFDSQGLSNNGNTPQLGNTGSYYLDWKIGTFADERWIGTHLKLLNNTPSPTILYENSAYELRLGKNYIVEILQWSIDNTTVVKSQTKPYFPSYSHTISDIMVLDTSYPGENCVRTSLFEDPYIIQTNTQCFEISEDGNPIIHSNNPWFDEIGDSEPYEDYNSNGIWDSDEPYEDYNSNGIWDQDLEETHLIISDIWFGMLVEHTAYNVKAEYYKQQGGAEYSLGSDFQVINVSRISANMMFSFPYSLVNGWEYCVRTTISLDANSDGDTTDDGDIEEWMIQTSDCSYFTTDPELIVELTPSPSVSKMSGSVEISNLIIDDNYTINYIFEISEDEETNPSLTEEECNQQDGEWHEDEYGYDPHCHLYENEIENNWYNFTATTLTMTLPPTTNLVWSNLEPGEYCLTVDLYSDYGNGFDYEYSYHITGDQDCEVLELGVDTDQDGIPDETDDFPFNSEEWIDSDKDGFGDNSDPLPHDATQWSDLDGDGFGDNLAGSTPDLFPNDATQWSDLDGDGFGDNWDNVTWNLTRFVSWPGTFVEGADMPDYCPIESGNSHIDGVYGCKDDDGDGLADFLDDEIRVENDSDLDDITNNQDHCPNTDIGQYVNEYGCSYEDYIRGDFNYDFDGDGIVNTYDLCENTPSNSTVGQNGCLNDYDGDGISDDNDRCVDSRPHETVDDYGCSRDSDGDGIPNDGDSCDNSRLDLEVDQYGCTIAEESVVESIIESVENNKAISSSIGIGAIFLAVFALIKTNVLAGLLPDSIKAIRSMSRKSNLSKEEIKELEYLQTVVQTYAEEENIIISELTKLLSDVNSRYAGKELKKNTRDILVDLITDLQSKPIAQLKIIAYDSNYFGLSKSTSQTKAEGSNYDYAVEEEIEANENPDPYEYSE